MRFAVVFLGTLLLTASCLPDASLKQGEDALRRGDEGRALEILLPLAERGNPLAQRYVGETYGHTPEFYDFGQAVRWLKKAGKQGETMAYISLGMIYNEGKVVPENKAEAWFWFRLAGELGDPLGETFAVMGPCGESAGPASPAPGTTDNAR